MLELPENISIIKNPATKEEEDSFFNYISYFSEKDDFPKYLILKLFYMYENTYYCFDHFLKRKIQKQISQILKITTHLDIDARIHQIFATGSFIFVQKLFDIVFCTEKLPGRGISTSFKLQLFEELTKTYRPYHREMTLSFFRFAKYVYSIHDEFSEDIKFILFNELSHIHFKNITLLDILKVMGVKAMYRCIFEKENFKLYIQKYLQSEESLICVKKPILFGHLSIFWNKSMHLFPVNKKRKTQYGTTMTLMLSLKRLQNKKCICKNDPALFEFMFESLNGVDLTHFLLN
jgi:hypothetical protein